MKLIDINNPWDIAAGIFLLIFIYLILSKASLVNQMIGTTSTAVIKGIGVLQGRGKV